MDKIMLKIEPHSLSSLIEDGLSRFRGTNVAEPSKNQGISAKQPRKCPCHFRGTCAEGIWAIIYPRENVKVIFFVLGPFMIFFDPQEHKIWHLSYLFTRGNRIFDIFCSLFPLFETIVIFCVQTERRKWQPFGWAELLKSWLIAYILFIVLNTAENKKRRVKEEPSNF